MSAQNQIIVSFVISKYYLIDTRYLSGLMTAVLYLVRLLAYSYLMHEMSIASSIFELARAEAAKHGASRLTLLRVRHGSLSNLVPEAMHMAFTILVQGTSHAGAKLELVEEKLRLRCGLCGQSFLASGRESLFEPCPLCDETTSYQVQAGEGIFLDHLEAE